MTYTLPGTFVNDSTIVPVSAQNMALYTAAITSLDARMSSLVYNVKDPPYGAIGNGVTDDTTAIQAAINACGVTGGVVWFPPGTYLCNTLTNSAAGVSWLLSVVKDNVTLAGAGRDATILKSTVSSANAIYFIWASGNGKNSALTNWATTRYSAKPVYTVQPVVTGAQTVTLVTVAQTSNFAVGDWIYLRSGQVVSASIAVPDCELNIVSAINAGTGVITLQWPTAKPYVQEYYPTATAQTNFTGPTTTTVTAFTAPLGVSNVTTSTMKNFAIRDIGFSCTGGGTAITYAVVGTGIYGFDARRLNIASNESGVAMQEGRAAIMEDIDGVFGTSASRINYAVGLATCATDCFVSRIRTTTTGTSVGAVHLHEGVARTVCRDLIFLNQPGLHSGGTAVLDIRARAYGLNVDNVFIVNSDLDAPGAVYVDETCTGKGLLNNLTIRGSMTRSVVLGSAGWQVGLVDAPKTTSTAYTAPSVANKAPIVPLPVGELSAFVDFGDSSVFMGTIPPDSYIKAVRAQVFTAFNAGTLNQLNVGLSGVGTNTLINSLDISTTGVKSVSSGFVGWVGTSYDVTATTVFTGAVPTTGRVLLTVEFARSLSQ